MIRFLYIGLLFIALGLGIEKTQAQDVTEKPTRILFLIDGSSSMMNGWKGKSSKWNVAKGILFDIVDSLSQYKNIQTALRIYGHQSGAGLRDCKDTKLEVGFFPNNASSIKSRLDDVRPKGITPVAYSLEKCAGDFPDNKGRNIIILLTDGGESCEGDPCQVALYLEKQNIVLKHFVIGMGIDESTMKAFGCMGTFYNATSPANFQEILTAVVKRVINETSLQVLLLDTNEKASETNVNMTFYDAFTSKLKFNYYHAFDHKGLADTLWVDPAPDYQLQIHTRPEVWKEDITLDPNVHNVVSVLTPQGDLNLQLEGITIDQHINNKIKCLVKKKDNGEVIHVQPFDQTRKYLVGVYELEVLTLPRIILKDIEIKQHETTAIKIATPGILNIVKKYEMIGAIFHWVDGKLEKIYDLDREMKVENIALQPGDYRIIFRPAYAKSMYGTDLKDFSIKSGGSVSLNL